MALMVGSFHRVIMSSEHAWSTLDGSWPAGGISTELG